VRPPAERLKERLSHDGDCLVWTGSTNSGGRPQIVVDYKLVYAYRLAWELEHGAIPLGYHIHHKCGNPTCCTVEHLEALTASDHSRLRRGSSTGTAGMLKRLTSLQAARKKRGFVQEDLAALTGISRSTIAELETGGRKARPATVGKLAAALRTTPAKLY